MQNVKHEQVYNTIKFKGPLLPSQVSKEVGIDGFMSTAILSELVKAGRIKQTYGKIGSSNVYYVDEQKLKALGMLYNSLSDVFKKLVNELKDLRVVPEDSLDPRRRVLYKRIEDFALEGKLKVNNREIGYWRYFAIEQSKAEEMMMLSLVTKEAAPEKKPEPEIRLEVRIEPKPQIIITPHPEVKLGAPLFRREEKPAEPVIEKNAIAVNKPEPVVEIKDVQEPLIKKEEVKFDFTQPAPKPKKSSSFSEYIEEYFANNKAKILKKMDAGKKEINFIVEAPTAFGVQKFFVKAKDKKSLTKNDLSLAWAESSKYNLPSIFLTNGKMSKSTKDFQQSHISELFRVVSIE